MARSETEKKEYSRGYQRGRARAYDYVAEAFRIARAFREQAATQRRALLGGDNWTARECHSCERWTRGTPGCCKWGICSADFLAEVGEPKMWTDGGQIVTHENFGCCNHLNGNPLREKAVS